MRIAELLYEYNDGDKMLALQKAMERAGFTHVGYGSNALVMRDRDGGIVKVFEPDPCYRAFLGIIQKNANNPHFPRIRKLARFPKGQFFGNYIIKMESLDPLSREEYNGAIGFHCFVAKVITRSPYSLNMSFTQVTDFRQDGGDVTHMAQQWAADNPEFAAALRLISKQKRGCRDDLHRENIMKRQSTWVITDPFASA
jgi:hypothetical protein